MGLFNFVFGTNVFGTNKNKEDEEDAMYDETKRSLESLHDAFEPIEKNAEAFKVLREEQYKKISFLRRNFKTAENYFGLANKNFWLVHFFMNKYTGKDNSLRYLDNRLVTVNMVSAFILAFEKIDLLKNEIDSLKEKLNEQTTKNS